MNAITLILAFTALVAIGLGIAVASNNYSRKANQAFLISSICMLLWLLSNIFIVHARNAHTARLGINFAYAVAAFIPTTFQLLRLAIKFPDLSWLPLLKKAREYIVLNILVSASCFLSSFTKSVSFPVNPDGSSLPIPDYGLAYLFFNIYFLFAIGYFAYCLNRDRKILQGAQRIELEFLGFACIAGLVVGLTCGTIFALVIKTSAPVPIAHAISVLTLATIVAYGISVHKILAVAFILRKITTYLLLSCYLSVVYILSWLTLTYFLKEIGINETMPAHIASTLIVVYSMSSVRNWMQQAADKIITIQTTDIPKVIKEAGVIFQSVTTYNALLSQFTEFLSRSFSAPSVVILEKHKDVLSYAHGTDHTADIKIALDSFLTQLSITRREPICVDSMLRERPSPQSKGARQQLSDINMSIAAGIFSQSELIAMVLLSPRESGRIYDKNEQDALQMLCNQFSVALVNAYLYTKMQDSKIQNEIMLDQLVSGVVVANPDGEITLFNHEAQRITGIDEKKAVGQHIQILPKEIYLALGVTLENKNGVRNIDAALFPQEDSEESGKNIRMGSAFLFGHDGKPMGALLVFTDITELKGLEEQVRRSDQLSSVGTLAAGMAHEIKNPLVTIKTFTQLLPKRYGDEDFRNDFSSLVAHEVNRIDGIVNELLSFSKPAKPHLIAMNIQETIDQALKLIHEQLLQKNITLTNNCRAVSTHIFGDAKLLSQALINLNLNAIEAIGESGSITFGTLNCSHRFANGVSPGKATTRKCIRLQISDTGKGIERSDLQKIFDPFFTSKSEGTGMGLSVAHGIITEHHGIIEVESEPGRGTSFYIYIPLLEEGTVS